MTLRDALELFNSLGVVVIPIGAYLWKTLTAKMHAENQESLNKINNSLVILGNRIDNHIDLDDVKHKDFERRIDKIEE